ncbi:hypothetical protein TRFO_25272 [Tritrichomonas foetus]|uniref:Uncharacterized protein n=1 Tax=Tritrichomonas foetus TaxID=1144522 RepID=A0A1J4KAX0_9EUKA|nr:hypothetical protein TRFO_25272 [Tritrichomonas foetus]|eukprot:OHT06605.1 hypothetical protein TRFO_25272 [Tritrichomonas foetus]
MNLTAIALALIWNSPNYCICSETSSNLCKEKCTGFGKIITPDSNSIYRTIRNNINQNITFTLVGFEQDSGGLNVTFSNSFFHNHCFSIQSGTDHQQKIILNIEEDFQIPKLELININFSIISEQNIRSTFHDLCLRNSYFDEEIPENFSMKIDFLDSDYHSIIGIDFENTTFEIGNISIILPNYSNELIIHNSKFALNGDICFNASLIACKHISFIQLANTSEPLISEPVNITITLKNAKLPVSWDFSQLLSTNIFFEVHCEDSTNLVNLLYVNYGSNTLNIFNDLFYDDTTQSETTSISDISTTYDFLSQSATQLDNDFDSNLNNNLNHDIAPINIVSPFDTISPFLEPSSGDHTFSTSTYSEMLTPDKYYSDDDDYISESVTISATPENTDTEDADQEKNFIFTPFFFADGTGDIFVNNKPLQFDQSNQIYIDEFTNIQKTFDHIQKSSFSNLVIYILSNVYELEIPASLFYKKSFHLISQNKNRTIIRFENSNFSKGTSQYFNNVQIESSYTLHFSDLGLFDSLCVCPFDYASLTTDFESFKISSNKFDKILHLIMPDDHIPIIYTQGIMEIEDHLYNILSIDELTITGGRNATIIYGNHSISNSSSINLQTMNSQAIKSSTVKIIFDMIHDFNITLYNFSVSPQSLEIITIYSNIYHVEVVSDFEFPTPNPIKVYGDLDVNFNNLSILLSKKYCICQDTSKLNCNDCCSSELGPIIPFQEDIISSTVIFLPVDYVNYTIFGSSESSKPFFNYSIYNSTSLGIHSGDTEPSSLTLQTTGAGVVPKSDVVCSLKNLNLYIAPTSGDLYLNFATAFFSSLSFFIPDNCILKISSDSVDTDVLTLLKFPDNLQFASPRHMCNISCSNIISTFILLSNQQIVLKSQDYNISYKLDLSLLLHTPANLSCEYGTSKSAPLTIMLPENQPKSLADIPDLRFDVSKIPNAAYVCFPDQWNSNIEDVSSKIEIFHGEDNLYIQGKVVDEVYTTTPPTIFHNGIGDLYVNGILSTFKIKYCVCDSNYSSNCQVLCSSVGPIIQFDQESITLTIKSNPTRHISYVIYGSTPDYRPYFRLSDFSVKSFTLSANSMAQPQYIDLESTPSIPVVPLNHRFSGVSIRPKNESSSLKFYNLELQNSQIDPCLSCSISQIGLIIDFESAYALYSKEILSPSKTLSIIGKQSLKRVVLYSLQSIMLFGSNDTNFAILDLSQLTDTTRISTLIGSSIDTMLRVELPSTSCDISMIPNLVFDLTQLTSNECYMLFPTSRWTNTLSNLTTKLTVEHGRHDFFEESSKHDDKYDGLPPLLNTVGTGGYYINGKLVDSFEPSSTPKSSEKPFKSLGPSEIAGIVIGSCAFVVLVTGIIVFTLQKRKSLKRNSESEISTSKVMALIDTFSSDGE